MTTTLRFTPLYLTYQSPFSLSSYPTLLSPLLPLPTTYSSTHFDIFRELRPARSSRKSILRWLEGVHTTYHLLAHSRSTPYPSPFDLILLHYLSLALSRVSSPRTPRPTPVPPTTTALPPTPSVPLFLFHFSFFFLRFFCLLFSGGANRETRTADRFFVSRGLQRERGWTRGTGVEKGAGMYVCVRNSMRLVITESPMRRNANDRIDKTRTTNFRAINKRIGSTNCPVVNHR